MGHLAEHGIHDPGTPTPTAASGPTDPASSATTRSGGAQHALGAGLGGWRTCATTVPSPPRATPSVLVAPMSMPITVAILVPRQHLLHCGVRRPRTAMGDDPDDGQVERSRPAVVDQHHGPGSARSASSASVSGGGARRAPGRPPAGPVGESRRGPVAGRPHGTTRPRCWARSRPAHQRRPVRSGRSPSTGARPGPRPAARLFVVRRERAATARQGRDPASRLGQPVLGEPSLGHRGDDRRLDRAHQRLVLVGTDAEQVGARDQRQHGRLRDPALAAGAGHVEGIGDDDALESQRGAGGRARPGSGWPAGRSSALTTMCEVITEAAPARSAAANGTSSRASRTSSGASIVGSERWLSVAVSPCPGKCLRQAATPADCSPRPTPRRAARRGRGPSRSCGPDDRVVGVAVDVGHGTEVEVDAAVRERRTDWRPVARGERQVVGRAERRGAEDRAAGRVVQPGDVAALLVGGDHGGRPTPRISSSERRTAGETAGGGVAAEQADPAEALLEEPGPVGRQRGAGEGRQLDGEREPFDVAALIPSPRRRSCRPPSGPARPGRRRSPGSRSAWSRPSPRPSRCRG